MATFGIQITIVVAMLVFGSAGPGIAIYFLIRRKRLARARRRSPITRDLLRGPGHSLREEIDEVTNDVVWDLALLMIMPLFLLSTFLVQGVWLGGIASIAGPGVLYAIFIVGFVVYFVRKLMRNGEQLDRLKAGYDAELAAGQVLDQLMRQGAYVYHDVPGEKFNVDHVVVSSSGVFAIETKGFTKVIQEDGKAAYRVSFDGRNLRFPTWSDTESLGQAERQAVWLSRWLKSATALDVAVVPVLALPGWFVERQGRGVVRVLNGTELSGLLKTRHAPKLSPDDIQRVVHQIDTRCRTVQPFYRAEK